VKTSFRQSFTKDLAGIKDQGLLKRVKRTIEAVEKATSLNRIKGLKKLRAGGNNYRIRIGDFRIGLAVEADSVIFVRFINRKDIYRYFP
jgi:mRNA interferase RelE/StbE